MLNKPRIRTLLIEILLLGAVAVAAAGGFLAYCIRMPGESYHGDLPTMDPGLLSLRDHLSDHIWRLAQQIGERNYLHMDNLNKAADYIEKQFTDMGYVPTEDVFGTSNFRNISVNLYGASRRDEIIVVGAHYDTVATSPGADDNASGVAGMLEIARALQGTEGKRTVRFMAFANEEQPFSGGDDMGSMVSAQHSRDRNENIVAMFSLEMIGFYTDEKHSQYYPRFIRRFYPSRGNFIGFVSDLRSRRTLFDAIGSFRQHAAFPSEGMSAPQWLVPDIRRSDNASYWSYGFPAVMVTDTSNFRNYNYHSGGDTYRTLNLDAMARVVRGLTLMINDLRNK